MPDRKAPPPPPAGGWTRREFIERVAGVTAGIACAGTLAGQIAACRDTRLIELQRDHVEGIGIRWVDRRGEAELAR